MKNKFKKQKQLLSIFFSLFSVFIGIVLIASAFRENISFFYTPSDIFERKNFHSKTFRLGGIVDKDSFKYIENNFSVSFKITDFKKSILVKYTGILPDLFREGRGIIVQGSFKEEIFYAKKIFAKHDENYSPIPLNT